MFLHLLNDTQQKAFLALAKQFVEADSTLSDEEHNLLELMYAETGLDFDAELPEGDVDTLLNAFTSRQARAAVLLELIGTGHADQEFSAQENEFVRNAAAQLGISEAEVRAMESWVERQLALAQEAERFWTHGPAA
jgi:uncharacterized tellurite resistance protein B-like protein